MIRQPPRGVDDLQGFRIGGSEEVREIVGWPDFWSQLWVPGAPGFNHHLEPTEGVGRLNGKCSGEPGFAPSNSGKIEDVPLRERARSVANLFDDDFRGGFQRYVAPAIPFGGEARRRLQMRTQEVDLAPLAFELQVMARPLESFAYGFRSRVSGRRERPERRSCGEDVNVIAKAMEYAQRQRGPPSQCPTRRRCLQRRRPEDKIQRWQSFLQELVPSCRVRSQFEGKVAQAGLDWRETQAKIASRARRAKRRW